MTCPSTDELAAFAAGAAGVSGAASAHVAGCADCQRRVRELRSLAAMLASLPCEFRRDCPDWETIAAYVDGSSLASASRIEKHLATCESCMVDVANFRMSDEFRTRQLPMLQPTRVLPSVKPRLLTSRWLLLAPAGVALALAVLIVVLITRDRQHPTMAGLHPATRSSADSGSVPPVRGAGPEARLHVDSPPPHLDSSGSSSESPALFRALPGVQPPFSAVFRYGSAETSREVSIPSPEALTLHSGARFSLRIFPKLPLWLYVLQEDAHGDVSVLFPSKEFQTGTNPLRPSASSIIPAPSRDFELDQTAGKEKIYLFYGAERIDRCERLLSLVGSHSSDFEVRQIVRALLQTAGPRDLSKPGHAAVEFSFAHQ